MSNSEDLNFVNILHSQKNAKIDQKVLVLFFAIFVFFFGALFGLISHKLMSLQEEKEKLFLLKKLKQFKV